MIDQIDAELSKWVEGLVKGVTPSFAPPTDPDDGVLAISLYLLEIVDDPRRQHTGRPKLQPSLRYLVTTRAGEPQDAHRLLGVLFYAAMDKPEYEVELERVDTELWSAFGIAPRPAFILRLPLPHEWKLPELPLVTQEATVDVDVIATLYGQVLGPGNTPLSGARVELPNLNRYTITDRRGRFSLACPAPISPNDQKHQGRRQQPIKLVVTARDREQLVTVQETGSEAAPVVFPFEISVTLYGKVVGPDNTPLARTQVEIPALQRSAVTDDQGQFTLANVPAAPAAKQLTIRSGDQKQLVSIQETGWAEAPIVIIFDPDSLNKKEA